MPNSDGIFLSRLNELGKFVKINFIAFSLSTIVGMVLGGLIAVAYPPLFEAVATVKIGRVGSVGMKIPEEYNLGGDSVELGNAYYYGLVPDFRMLVTSEELYRELAIMYNHRRAKRGLIEPPYVSDMNNLGDALEIVVKGKTLSQTREYVNNIVQKILSDHENLYESLKGANKKIRKRLIGQIEIAIDGCSAIEESVRKQSECNNLIEESVMLYELERSLLPPYTFPTELAGPIEITKDKSRSIVLYMTAGGFVGMSIGFLFVTVVFATRDIKRKKH